MPPPDVVAREGLPSTEWSGTDLRCSAWHVFTGPGPHWEQEIDQREADSEARIIRAISAAQTGATLDGVEPGWVSFLRRHLPVAAIASRATGLLLEDASGRCGWRSVSHGLSLQASMQLRQAQAIVLYTIDMEARFGVMPIDAARARWQDEPCWARVRRFLEGVADLDDWGSQMVAINLCFEPLVGQLLRREFAMKRGPAHGDRVTAVVADAGQTEWALTQEWTVALVRFLTSDAEHGAENRARLCAWLAEHRSRAMAACHDVARLAEQLPHPAPRDTAVQRVVDDHNRLIASAGLSLSGCEPHHMNEEGTRP